MESNKQSSIKTIETEELNHNIAVARRTQLEQALKELNGAKTDKDKESVVNSFFDLERATIRIETAEREISNRQAALQDYSAEYEKVKIRYVRS